MAPQVVFEVLSPGNTRKEIAEKRVFYERYGVEEYYLYDPDNGHLQGWWRQGGRLVEIAQMRGWVSPRLRVHFDLDGMDLCLTRPDGRRFASYVEVSQWAESAEQRAEQGYPLKVGQRRVRSTHHTPAYSTAPPAVSKGPSFTNRRENSAIIPRWVFGRGEPLLSSNAQAA